MVPHHGDPLSDSLAVSTAITMIYYSGQSGMISRSASVPLALAGSQVVVTSSVHCDYRRATLGNTLLS